MNRTEYKNNFGREHYERINLVVPKGMKDIIKALHPVKECRSMRTCKTLSEKTNAVYLIQCRLQKRTET